MSGTTALAVGAGIAWAVLGVLGFVGACCVLAETLWRVTGWLSRRDRG